MSSLIVALVLGCAKEPKDVGNAVPEVQAAPPEAAKTVEEGATLDLSGATPVDLTVEVTDDRIVTRLVDSPCIYTTATPNLIGDHLVFALHKKSSKMENKYANCGTDPTTSSLYAVSVTTGEAWILAQGFDAEAAGAWADGTYWLPLVGRGGIGTWTASGPRIHKPHKTVMDSAGLWDAVRQQYVVGSVNSPLPICQGAPRASCGSMVAVGPDGAVRARADRTSGLRGWISGGVSSDGDHYFIGTGNGQDGDNSLEGNPMRECSVVKLDGDLNVVASYDDGVPGCKKLGRVKSAVIGEMPVVDGTLYVQHIGSTERGNGDVPFVKLKAEDLSLVCRGTFPAGPDSSVASFYQAPVVDERGIAYFTTASLDNDNRGTLYRVSEACDVSVLHKGRDKRVGTPTLADDRYVVYGDRGTLHIVDRDSGKTRDLELGSKAQIVGGAVLSDAGVSVVSTDGTVTTLKTSGLSGYGSAPWPRFRKDDHGTALE